MNKSATSSIMIVGVGGQGSLLASRVIGSVFLALGNDVKVSEVHGMSQRGGSVVTYVRFGENVASPVVCEGEADIILSFEQLEAARWLPCLKPDGTIITGTQRINPMPVVSGAAVYPEQLIDKLHDLGVDIRAADASSLAEQAGSVKAANVVLIGMLSKLFSFNREVWIDALRQNIPAKLLEINLAAFALGEAAA
jgi:Pyruvate:ferredoxin oxidoreductase and related 2-oxoacid:ferredoxin oxidoreductases, gamma subunit